MLRNMLTQKSDNKAIFFSATIKQMFVNKAVYSMFVWIFAPEPINALLSY